MRLRDYFRGIALEGCSPLPPEECARRINAAARSTWNPFAHGPAGRIKNGRLKLEFASPVGYNAAPLITGTLVADGGGTRFDLSYRAPRWVIPFYALSYLILLAVTPFAIEHAWPRIALGLSESGEKLVPLAIVAVLLIWPLILHYLFTWNAMRRLDALLSFLAETAEAEPCVR